MNGDKKFHHCSPLGLRFFSDNRGRPTSTRRERALSFFRESGESKVGRIRRIKLPVSELAEDRLPAVSFTRNGGQPVLIRSREGSECEVRLWDHRESRVSLEILEDNLSPESFLLVEEKSGSRKKANSVFRSLGEGRAPLALGGFAGLIGCFLLALIVTLLFRGLEGLNAETGKTEAWMFAASGLVTILSMLAFFQTREHLGRRTRELAEAQISRSQGLPAPRSVARFACVDSGRILVEVLAVPVLISVGTILLGNHFGSIAGWSACVACVSAGIVFAGGLPRLLDEWTDFRHSVSSEEVPLEEEELPANYVEDIPAVRTHNLFLAHPDESRPPLINQVSLNVAHGEKVGFLGKTSTDTAVFFRVLSGLIDSDRGVVWIDGKMVAGDQSSRVGWFTERTSFIAGTVRENICLGLEGEIPAGQLETAAALTGLDQVECLVELGWDTTISEKGHGLNDDERMRLQLTRSLVHQPDILIMIAPRDPRLEKSFLRILENYLRLKRGRNTLLLGASRGTSLKLTGRTIFLEDGKVVADGGTEEILESLRSDLVTS